MDEDKPQEEDSELLNWENPNRTTAELFDLVREELIDLEGVSENGKFIRDATIINSLPNQEQLKAAARQLLRELELALQIRDLGHEL